MSELDDALELAWEAGPATEPGVEAVAAGTLGEGWVVGSAVNGGVLMALGVHALAAGLAPRGHAEVLTWSAVFLSAAQPGPVEVRTEVLRTGRTVSTAQARLIQPGAAGRGGEAAERTRITATFGGGAALTEPGHRAPPVPAMPDPDRCLPARRDSSPAAAAITILDRLDVRIDPATAGFAAGHPTGRGELRVWVRLRDGREPGVEVLPLIVDCLMPAAFDLGVGGWAPTFELSGQVLGTPAPGWLRVRVTADAVAGSVYVEDADVWDSTGRLVARSRQLAGIRVPESGLPPPR